MCLSKTARFTMMLAVISLPMGSCWQPSFPAVREASLMKEYWLYILWHPTTWARCFTQSDLVSIQQEVRVDEVWEPQNFSPSKKCNSLNISICSNRKHLSGHLANHRRSTAGEILVMWSGQERCWYGGAAKECFLFLKGLHCLTDSTCSKEMSCRICNLYRLPYSLPCIRMRLVWRTLWECWKGVKKLWGWNMGQDVNHERTNPSSLHRT